MRTHAAIAIRLHRTGVVTQAYSNTYVVVALRTKTRGERGPTGGHTPKLFKQRRRGGCNDLSGRCSTRERYAPHIGVRNADARTHQMRGRITRLVLEVHLPHARRFALPHKVFLNALSLPGLVFGWAHTACCAHVITSRRA